MVSSVKSVLILLPFHTVALHESGTKKSYILVSEYLSSQYNLTAQIEPVQDNNITSF